MRPRLDTLGEPGRDSRGRPSPLVTLIVLALGAGLITILVAGFRSGAWGPAPASGQAAKKAPPHVTIKAALDSAHQHLKQNEPGKAEAILRDTVSLYPDDQELRLAYGETFMHLRTFPEAYEQYVAALAIGPRQPEIEFTAGTLANTIGKPDRAIEHYSAAQSADPKNPTYPLYLAQVQLKLNQNDGAKANLFLSARLDPENAIVWGTLADLAVRENNVNIALQHIAKARQLQPGVATWRVIEARALKRKGDAEQALLVLSVLNPAERREDPVLRLFAECYGMLNRPLDAATAFADASDVSPGNADLAYEAAAWYARAEKTDKARIFALRAHQNGNAAASKLLERLGK